MASTRFLLVLTSVLSLATVLVFYIASSKIERKALKMLEILSGKEDVGFHSTEISLIPKQRLTNAETTSHSYAEKLLKLYDGVETFVMFTGYPRSSHSLVAAILDAHPEIIIPNEYNVIECWNKYRPSTARKTKMSKYHLFYDLHQLSRDQALFGLRSKFPGGKISGGYSYNVPTLWQGGYQTRIKVIGDKKGGGTAKALDRLGNLSILEEINQVVQVPIKFIHVHRNPFDNIATMMLRATDSRDAVREKGVKKENKDELDDQIELYFKMAASNQRVRERHGDAVLDIPGHETVLRPKETLQRLCDHLGVTCSEDYFEKCSKILYGVPTFTRNKVVWTEEQKERVTRMMKKYPFMKEYSFDKYPR